MFYLCRINVAVIHIRMESELNVTLQWIVGNLRPQRQTLRRLKVRFISVYIYGDSYFSFVSLFAVIAIIIFIFTFIGIKLLLVRC